jgi:hypothetical protein
VAQRRSIPPTVIDGNVPSPDVRFSSFADISRYSLECTVESVADVIDPTKSFSIFVEWLDEVRDRWECWGGMNWRGGTAAVPANGTPVLRLWAFDGNLAVIDRLKGARVRVRATAPATLWEDPQVAVYPGTVGPVTVSARVLDERGA